MKPLCSSRFSCENEQAEAIRSDSENFGKLIDTISHESDQIDSNGVQQEAESVEKYCSQTVLDDGGDFGLEEEETTKLVFKFEYQNWNCNYNEEFNGGYGESSDFAKGGDAVSASTNKYEFISGKSFSHFLDELEAESFTVKECNSFEDSNSIDSKLEQSVKPNSQSLTTFDLEDSNRFDTLWEHQDLIEQLKMELKKVRATGLPTILEDSESPRIMEDLKPWKIDEKLQHGSSTTNELPKFYRSYRERMRKFDILNYQKMYAIGYLQSKDPLQSFSTRKNPSPAFTYILPRGFRLSRRKHTEADPTKKFVRELYSDLEMVYVGQLCLSWEFLHWEYDKALKLWESDQYGLLRFNEVAGEFQQFQVLLQRFIENEPFQGPRVENYARNRCAMRNLLQVPVIREDNAKDKRKFRKREADKDGITSDMLVDILEESIRTIWRFIRADKDASSLALKGLRENHVELQDPSDSELLAEIRTDLQKKEKRLREVLRSGSCILKKFQKHNEDATDQVLYFFSQVDMKLVWRVLNMSRITTDQLAWCRSKLNKINFVNRRIHVEPSFLLFPS
uniref:Ribosomal protein L34Ae n=1 Tax=Cajanus cajan TaxID=3821 RepID=A0A151UB62_CAJCA|nr:hypothetical protein KK1_020806 [Cajanus cajan]